MLRNPLLHWSGFSAPFHIYWTTRQGGTGSSESRYKTIDQAPGFLTNRASAGPKSSSLFLRRLLAFLFCSSRSASILSLCSSIMFLFPFFLRCFRKLLFFPRPLFFNFRTGSSGFRSRSASCLRCAADAKSSLPTKSGLSEIISGCSLFSNAFTSLSCRCCSKT